MENDDGRGKGPPQAGGSSRKEDLRRRRFSTSRSPPRCRCCGSRPSSMRSRSIRRSRAISQSLPSRGWTPGTSSNRSGPCRKRSASFSSPPRRTREEVDGSSSRRSGGSGSIWSISPRRAVMRSICRTVPYIFTIWDLCHLEHPEFPEVTAKPRIRKSGKSFVSRAVVKALTTLTDGLHTTGARLAALRRGGRAFHRDAVLSGPASAGAALLFR